VLNKGLVLTCTAIEKWQKLEVIPSGKNEGHLGHALGGDIGT
jgi:hypothetical protein